MPAVPIPAPDENAKAWDSLSFKQGKVGYDWPEDEEYGLVEWSSFKTSAKIDKKAKSGAAKPRVTQTGGEAVTFSFTLRIAYHIPEALTTVQPILDKLRPGAGPFEFNHPWAAFDGIRGFLVESVERFPPEDGELRVTIGCVEVNPDAQSGKGGNVTKTPTREEQYNRAQDEWLARARAAQAFQQNENLNRAQDLTDQAAANGDDVGARVPKKLHSVFVGEDEISGSPAQPKKAEPTSNTATATGSASG
jgi:hypothetical protein